MSAVRNPSQGYTPSEVSNQFNLFSKAGTLNHSDDAPGKLAFVLVFKDQHPEWESAGKILCKTNLDLLSSSGATPAAEQGAKAEGEEEEKKKQKQKGDEEKEKENGSHDTAPVAIAGSGGEKKVEPSTSSSPPNNDVAVAEQTDLPTDIIPIFTQLTSPDRDRSTPPPSWPPVPHYRRKRPEDARFLFAGYYRLKHVRYLEPRSEELIAMLDLKFTPQGKKRSPESWHKSLALRWAVARFERVSGECGDEGRGVNPMEPLKAMREVKVGEEGDGVEKMEGGKEDGARGKGKGVGLREMLEGIGLGDGKENRKESLEG